MSHYYPTPPEITNDILQLGVLNQAMNMLEPCAGQGHIIRVVRDWGFDYPITAVEINNQFEPMLKNFEIERLIMDDFFADDINSETIGLFDAIVTNPPFYLFEHFLTKCHSLLDKDGKLVFLLDMSLLVGVKRTKLLKKYRPSEVHLLARRPKFIESVSAANHCGYAWVIWNQQLSNTTILNWLN